ncbi:hypothetical protein H4R33_006926, partial [Dimargaris cristalligena]
GLYGLLIADLEVIKAGNALDETVQRVGQTWKSNLRQYFLSALFAHTEYMSDISTEIRVSIEQNWTIPKHLILQYYRFLKANQADPLFAPGVWRFVNPSKLDPQVKSTRFPLVAAVDGASNGYEVLDLFRAVADQFFAETIPKTWSPLELERIEQLVGNGPAPEQEFEWPELINRTARDVTTMIVARLATTDRISDLNIFVNGLEGATKSLGISYDIRRFNFNSMMYAVALAAQANQLDQLVIPIFPRNTTEPGSPSVVGDESWCLRTCHMRTIGLVRGAKILHQYLQCPEGNEDRFIYNAYPELEHILITNDNQMGIAAFTPEFLPGEITEASDMGDWAKPFHDVTGMNGGFRSDLFSRDLEPGYFRQLRQASFAATLPDFPDRRYTMERLLAQAHEIPLQF